MPIGFSGAVLTFAGLWGVPFLRQVHGLDPKTAAAITSILLVAWALGGPLLGSWSERMGMRKPLYLIASGVALLGWSAIIFLPLPLWALVVLLVPTGFASGNIIIGFAWAKESVPLRLVGTASGFCNMGPLLGGMLLQPAVGWMLDQRWNGALAGGVRIYDAARLPRRLHPDVRHHGAGGLHPDSGERQPLQADARLGRNSTPAGERAGGVLCTAHVIRRWPSAATSFFTSLCRVPHRPVRDTPWAFEGQEPRPYFYLQILAVSPAPTFNYYAKSI